MHPKHQITLDECRSYSSEVNLEKGLMRLGLYEYVGACEYPCRYIKCRTPDGRWTAVFLVGEFMRVNKTGGYLMFASQHGFMSV